MLPHRSIVHRARGAQQSNSLLPFCPPPYNQLNLGSCTAHAIVHTILTTSGECGPGKAFPPSFEPSRKYVYTQEVAMENKGQIKDVGADAADGCLLIATTGVCAENLMPYTPDPVTGNVPFGEA